MPPGIKRNRIAWTLCLFYPLILPLNKLETFPQVFKRFPGRAEKLAEVINTVALGCGERIEYAFLENQVSGSFSTGQIERSCRIK